MARVVVNFHTVVRHSAYGYKGDAVFKQGLESRHVGKAHDRDTIKRVGGLLFHTYSEAEDYAFHEMYDTHDELIPGAPGTFAKQDVDGLQIYVPKSTEHINFDDQGVVKQVIYTDA